MGLGFLRLQFWCDECYRVFEVDVDPNRGSMAEALRDAIGEVSFPHDGGQWCDDCAEELGLLDEVDPDV